MKNQKAFYILIFVIVFAVFSPSIFNEFLTWDDYGNFTENYHYRGLGLSHLSWMFTTFHKGPYQPLTWMTLGLDYMLWGMDPKGYHVSNILWHAFNAVLFFILACKIFSYVLQGPESPPRRKMITVMSLASVFIFALHPLRVESVAWITERRDVVSGFFYLAALISYINYFESKSSRKKRYVLTLFLFLLALLSKALAMTLPLTLLILDIYPLKRMSKKQNTGKAMLCLLKEKIPFFVLSICFGIVALWGQHITKSVASLEQYSLLDRIFITFYGIGFYISKTFLPLGLSPLYEMPVDPGILYPWCLFYGIFAFVVLFLSLKFRNYFPGSLTVFMNYIIVILPVSGFVQIGKHLVADRYSYLSCMGWALIIGGAAVAWITLPGSKQKRMKIFRVFFLLFLFFLSFMTLRQISFWKNTKVLWERVYSLNDHSFYALTGLANIARQEKDNEKALDRITRAHAVKADYESLNTYAIILSERKEYVKAVEIFQEAIKIGPDRSSARMNLAKLYGTLEKYRDAVFQYKEILKRDPSYNPARIQMAEMSSHVHDGRQKSSEIFQEALEHEESYLIYYKMGCMHAQKKEFQEAEKCFQKAVELKPDAAAAWVNLGNTYVMLGKNDKAVLCYKKALHFEPNNKNALKNLQRMERD